MEAKALAGTAAHNGGGKMKRAFLLLQGPATPFFNKLSQSLQDEGHTVHRVIICAGDALGWSRKSSWHIIRLQKNVGKQLADLYEKHGITDQVLFGDQRPIHRIARALGKQHAIRTHVFEEGYFRPFWVTLERDGVNRHSLLPRDVAWYRQVASLLPEIPPVVSFSSPFYRRAFHDVMYHLAGLLNPVFFPSYRNHAGLSAAQEYRAYLKRFGWLWFMRAREFRRGQAVIEAAVPYFLLPLQLNTDAQIRTHSPFSNMEEVIHHVLTSFSRHADRQAHIVIKNHPLDTGLMPYRRIVNKITQHLGISHRVTFIEDGDLSSLINHAAGVVTVNSTVGLIALASGIPTCTLSDPIYHLPGLTCQTSLDIFWQQPVAPDKTLFAQFSRCVMHATQVNGGFYSPNGIQLAVKNSVPLLCADQSPMERLS